MNQNQIINLIVVVLIAGSSVLSWVFRKLQEQAALKRAETERERRRIEALRTGRDDSDETAVRARAATPRVPAGPSTPTRPGGAEDLQRLAERRAQQLRQLREMQLAKQGGTGAPGAPRRADAGEILSIPGSAGPTVPGRHRPLPPDPSNQPKTEPNRAEQRRAKQARKAELEAARRAESEALKLTRTSRFPEGSDRAEDVASAARDRVPSEAEDLIPRPKPQPSPLANMSRADWKRAFLAKEVLGDPLSVRGDHLR